MDDPRDMDGATILTSQPVEGSLFANAARVCGVCHTQFSKYKCPRCSIAYCSLGCYKRHGESCTENFYAEQAFAQMRSDVAPSEQRLEMMRTLQRLEEQDDVRDDGGDGDSGDEEDESDAAAPAVAHDAEQLTRLLEHWWR